MELDDELCLCFHVSKRKVINFIRVERPVRAGQLSECFGAGTGCGWCRPFLLRLFEQRMQAAADQSGRVGAVEPSADEYARNRSAYVKAGGGVPPPGATPVDRSESPNS